MGFLAKLLLYVLSIFWIIIGVLLTFATDMVRGKFLNKLLELKGERLKKLSVIPIVIGILLFLSASANEYTIYVIVIGLLAIIKGIVGIVATEKMEKFAERWSKMSNNAYRIWGVVTIILGIILLRGIYA